MSDEALGWSVVDIVPSVGFCCVVSISFGTGISDGGAN